LAKLEREMPVVRLEPAWTPIPKGVPRREGLLALRRSTPLTRMI
jgi:hypothetical protein